MAEDILGFFDGFLRNYENGIFQKKNLGIKYLSDIEARFVLSHHQVKNGDKVLDMGISTGRFANSFANNGVIVEGVDVSQGMVKETKKKMKVKPVIFKLANVEKKMQYPDNIFYSVIYTNVLKYIPTCKKTISEISRILKKDGVFILTISLNILIKKFINCVKKEIRR